ncbi:MAG: hypothetical protein LIP12_15255 [Clostridiales bacterium]|nr:hypothetical protein [Clostridiales bacterium]
MKGILVNMERYSILKQMRFGDKEIWDNTQTYENACVDTLNKNSVIANEEWAKMRREVEDIEYHEDRDDMAVRPTSLDVFNSNNATICMDISSNKYDAKITDILFRNVNLHVKNAFRNIIQYLEYKIDVMNEIYLYTAFQSDKLVPIFFGMKNLSDLKQDDIYSEWEKRYSSLNKFPPKMMPFTIPSKYSRKMKTKLVGCGIVRTWLYSKEFQRLFKRITGLSDKYKWTNIMKQLEEGLFTDAEKDENEIEVEIASESEAIILEKLFGFNTIICFNRYIRSYVKDFSEKDLEVVHDLMKKVMEYEGCYGRCVILQIIGRELMIVPNSPVEYRKRMFCLYKDYLEEVLPQMNEDFKNLVKIYAYDILKRESQDSVLPLLKSDKEMCFQTIELREKRQYCTDFKELTDFKDKVDDDSASTRMIQIIIDGNLNRYFDNGSDS